MASVGHIKDLPTSKLGVDLDNDFEPQYVTIKGKSKVLADIKKKAEEADKIFLAPDPDREGEAIAWHLAQELRGKSKKKSDGRVFRVLFNEITEAAIKRALQSPGQIDMKLVNAQQARRVLDRIVGYQGSQLLWKKVRRGLSAWDGCSRWPCGSCASEKQSGKRFVRKSIGRLPPYLAGTNPPPFEAKLHSINGEEASIGNAEQAAAHRQCDSGQGFRRHSRSSGRKRNGIPWRHSSRAGCSRRRPVNFISRRRRP